MKTGIFTELTPERVSQVLKALGLKLDPGQIRVEAREQRYVAFLPDQRLAWFAASEPGLTELARERRVLRLLAQRCEFQAPRLLHEATDGGFDLRAMVPGRSEPWQVYERVLADAALAGRIGEGIGRLLADQHAALTSAEAQWLPSLPDWPAKRDWIGERLPRVCDDAELIANAHELIAAYEALDIPDSERVLVHTDLGFHNLVIADDRVIGVFDYGGAAWADYHHDFRYLLFDQGREELLQAAAKVYTEMTGREVSLARAALYNAACAITFLACRDGYSALEKPCGRTLEQDLHWTRYALKRSKELT